MGDSGNDTISIMGKGNANGVSQSAGRGYRLFQGSAKGGMGNDRLNVVGRGSVKGYGGFQAAIEGGAGDDLIMVSGTTLGIVDSLINGGDGNDVFNVGTGSGTIEGGIGTDRINLSYFDATTMQITRLDSSSLEIVGTQDNQGNDNAWVQKIFNVERYQIGVQIYNLDQLENRVLGLVSS